MNMVNRFDLDYELGKESEKNSLTDLRNIFGNDLQESDNQFENFDFYSLTLRIELKTRNDIHRMDNKFFNIKEGREPRELNSLMFDSVKMLNAVQTNKARISMNEKPLRHFICWKCNNEYYYWEMKFNEKGHVINKEDYFLEDQEFDRGHGYIQPTKVIKVHLNKITFP